MNEIIQALEAVYQSVHHGGIAVAASFIRYMWEYSKGTKFNILVFIVHGLAGLIIGNIAFNLIPETYAYKISMMWLTGFLSYPLLNVIDKKGIGWIEQYVTKRAGVSDDSK